MASIGKPSGATAGDLTKDKSFDPHCRQWTGPESNRRHTDFQSVLTTGTRALFLRLKRSFIGIASRCQERQRIATNGGI